MHDIEWQDKERMRKKRRQGWKKDEECQIINGSEWRNEERMRKKR